MIFYIENWCWKSIRSIFWQRLIQSQRSKYNHSTCQSLPLEILDWNDFNILIFWLACTHKPCVSSLMMVQPVTFHNRFSYFSWIYFWEMVYIHIYKNSGTRHDCTIIDWPHLQFGYTGYITLNWTLWIGSDR